MASSSLLLKELLKQYQWNYSFKSKIVRLTKNAWIFMLKGKNVV